MTPKEKKLTVALLKMAAGHFGEHGCNDMDKALLVSIGFTDEEKVALATEFHETNGDLEECGEITLQDFDWIGDSSWMSFLASKLEQVTCG
jgi:hypothetical protein